MSLVYIVWTALLVLLFLGAWQMQRTAHRELDEAQACLDRAREDLVEARELRVRSVEEPVQAVLDLRSSHDGSLLVPNLQAREMLERLVARRGQVL